MQKQEFQDFSDMWNGTLEAKGQQPYTERALVISFEDLIHYDLETIQMALHKFRTNPDEGQYRLQASALIKIIEGDSDSAANKAWSIAYAIATSHGGFDDIVIHDRIAMKVIAEAGGLQRLCNFSDPVSLEVYKSEFKSLYKHYRINGFDSCPDVLVGSNNFQRELFGLEKRPPLYLGVDGKKQNAVSLPDMTKPRYPQVAHADKNVDPKAVLNGMKSLLSISHINPKEAEDA